MKTVYLYSYLGYDSSKAYTIESKQKSTEFDSSLKKDDYEKNLNDVLDTLSDDKQEVHLRTLDFLEKEGLTKVELDNLNKILLQMQKRESSVKLTTQEEKNLQKYNTLFNAFYEQVQAKRQENLELKDLKLQTFRTDTLLKTKDMIDGVKPKEYQLKIEV